MPRLAPSALRAWELFPRLRIPLVALGVFAALLAKADPSPAGAPDRIPTYEEAFAAKQDVWGLAAMRQPNGPNYEFFEKLLPPLRYVNAGFRYYPIPLSGPNATVKARLISNGSGINLPAGARSWNDAGTVVRFHVGPDQFAFGSLHDRLSEPTLEEGWLPIVQIRYQHASPPYSDGVLELDHPKPAVTPEIYRLEAFASTEAMLASNGVVFVQFDLAQGTNGWIAVEVGGKDHLRFLEGKVMNPEGQVLAIFDSGWKWERQLATRRIAPGVPAFLAIATKPLEPDVRLQCRAGIYAAQRKACSDTWRNLLAQGMNLETPEPIVNNAWRHLIVQNFELFNGDRIHYSSGNQYDKLYEAEGSDAAWGMLAWGYEGDMRRWLVPLFDFTRKNLECHQAGFKLQNLANYFWQTRDANAVRALRPRWEKEARLLANSRTNEAGLCPKGQYCGDIHTLVYSLTVNAKGWRALRDLAVVLDEVGEKDQSAVYARNAAEFRKAVLKAVAESARNETRPPFVPVALYTNEPAHDPITERRIGSYWNVVIDYVAASGVFPPGSPEELWIPRYQEEYGGLCMGMLRSGGAHSAFWTSEHQVWPLYTTRYALECLRRDEPERMLVSLYGALAQGFTRNTFICGEGCALTPLDEHGRFFYCPPNSAANSHFLTMLRYALVQDWDLDDDGRPETLRLFFAAPRRWLQDGKTINLERAPTAFGPVSVRMESKLSSGEVIAEVHLPERQKPKRLSLRARVPEGWRVIAAQAGAEQLRTDQTGTVDLSKLEGRVRIRFLVERL